MNVLYLWLKHLHSHNADNPLPIDIGLKAYHELPFDGARADAIARFRLDTQPIRDLLERHTNANTVILVEGVDEYVKVVDPVEQELFALLHEYERRAKKVVGVGLNYVVDKDPFRRDLHLLREPAAVARLGGVDLDDAARFCRGFVTVAIGKPADTLETQRMRKAAELKFEQLDMFTASLLLERLSSTNYAHLTRSCEWYARFCRDALARHAGDGDLQGAARLAFEYAIKPGPVRHEIHMG